MLWFIIGVLHIQASLTRLHAPREARGLRKWKLTSRLRRRFAPYKERFGAKKRLFCNLHKSGLNRECH